MKYNRELPEGVSTDLIEASAKKGPGESNTLPRQVWGNINAAYKQNLADIEITLHYYGCTSRCARHSHEYTITFLNRPTQVPNLRLQPRPTIGEGLTEKIASLCRSAEKSSINSRIEAIIGCGSVKS
ncbi:hypothetical protein SH139x_002480 [Planctomycetaceae bacterium SH139]